MTVTDTIKDAVGLGDGARKSLLSPIKASGYTRSSLGQADGSRKAWLYCHRADKCWNATAASREAMSEARLPLQYRDSCAHLLIPLNRCRFEEYYLPWKCEVRVYGLGIPRYHDSERKAELMA